MIVYFLAFKLSLWQGLTAKLTKPEFLEVINFADNPSSII
jgi:hypothetical protein